MLCNEPKIYKPTCHREHHAFCLCLLAWILYFYNFSNWISCNARAYFVISISTSKKKSEKFTFHTSSCEISYTRCSHVRRSANTTRKAPLVPVVWKVRKIMDKYHQFSWLIRLEPKISCLTYNFFITLSI